MPRTPSVERVHDGLWSIPVTIPDNPLGYTLVYAFETASGPVLVDTGWDADASWRALGSGLAEAGLAVGDVYGVLVTHIHPDHHGLSERVRAESGAWVAMHPEDAWLVSRRRDDGDSWVVQSAAVMLASGAGEADLAEMPDPEALAASPPVLPTPPTRLFADGDIVDVPGWTVRAIWTPGHSPGHTCFMVEGPSLLLSGDHVLPKITPHIGLYHEESEWDPLGDYLSSLARLHSETVSGVLPAHLWRFDDLPPRLREITEHHEERLAAIEARLATGPATLWDITAAMPWNRAWEDIGGFMKRAALSEALAHVRYLERRGRVEKAAGEWPATYRLPRPAPPAAPAPAPPHPAPTPHHP